MKNGLSFTSVEILAPGRTAVLLACALALAAATHERNAVWSSEVTLWESVARRDITDSRTLVNLGTAYRNQGKYDDAFAAYSRALRRETSSEAHNGLGLALASLGRHAEAEQHFLEAIRLAPRSTDVYVNLGLLYLSPAFRNSVAARRAFENALRIDPELGQARLFLGYLERQQ